MKVSGLNKNDGLRGRNLKTPSAPHIFAHQLIVDANHIIARFFKAHTVGFVRVSRRVLFLDALEPAAVVVVALAAKRADKACCFRFLFLVKNIAFVHKVKFYYRSSEPKMVKSAVFDRAKLNIFKRRGQRPLT